MHTEISVQLASESHAAQIAEMSRAYIEPGLGWQWRSGRVLTCIHRPDCNVAVVLQGLTVLAFGIMSYGEREARLQLLAVRPQARRQGLARAIVSWLECVAIEAGIERVLVECRRSNDAARLLYLDMGFDERRIEAGMYRGLEDGIQLHKWLRTPN